MRIALTALFTLLASPVSAATIQGKYPMSCHDVATHKRIYGAVAAGDRAGVEALIRKAIVTGACRQREVGEQVRVEERSYPFVCVTPFGSTASCEWIELKDVDTRQ